MMLWATVVLSSREWLLPAFTLLALALGLLAWNYRSSESLRGGLRWACLALKSLGLAALAFCLLEPLWNGQRAKLGANLFAVVADNSQGLTIKDAGAPRTRGEWLKETLDPLKSPWVGVLDESFQVRRYGFDSRLQAVKDFEELTFDGRASAIQTSLRTLSERFRGRPLAGVLLFTDGNATDLAGGAFDTNGMPPIYPVVVGKPDPVKDLALQNVRVSQTDF